MTDKRTVAWVISMVLRQACTRSTVGGNNFSPECNVLRNRPGRVMTRIVLMVQRLANFSFDSAAKVADSCLFVFNCKIN